jgi:putative ABC transport system substrate-binding protein
MKKIILVLLFSILFLYPKKPMDNDGLPWIKINNSNMYHWKPEVISKKYLRLFPRNNKDIKYKIVAIFPKKSSAYDVSINKIMEVFSQKQIIATIDVVYIAKKDKKFGKRFLKGISANKYDLIFSVGSSATAFMYKNYKGKKIPVVSVCSKDPVLLKQMDDYTNGSGNNFAFTSLNMPITVQLNYLKNLIGEIDSIAILYARKNKSAVKTQVNPLKDLAKKENIKIFEVIVENQKNAKNELKLKIPQVLASMNKNKINKKKSFFWLTGSSSVLKEIKIINKYSKGIAVLSVVPNAVTEGQSSAALSIGISFESNAHLASVYGINILTKKTKVGDMKVGIVSPPDISLSFLKLSELKMKIPFDFFEIASTVYDYDRKLAKKDGKLVVK